MYVVVEKEGAQKIIRCLLSYVEKFDQKLCEKNRSESHVNDFLRCIEIELTRLISLLLAETGHWYPDSLFEGLEIVAKEGVISKKNREIVLEIPKSLLRISEQLNSQGEFKELDQSGSYFVFMIRLLCEDIKVYLNNAEIPT